jgi:hypothetical protein
MTSAGAASFFMAARGVSALSQQYGKKTIIITFGGGAQDQETFAPEGQQYFPRILTELISRSTFYTQVVNRGILGRYMTLHKILTWMEA